MQATIHNVEQGSPEWLDLRKNYFTASEANAMMGMCKHKTRTQLLHEKATGEKPVVSSFTQKIFDKGHKFEEMARPIIEQNFDDELYPLVMTKGDFLASLDGINFDYTMAWEHKQWNESLAEMVRNGTIPDSHIYQLEQQLYVSQAEKILFTVSDGTPEKMVSTWYTSNPEKQAQLIKGWEQFKYDLSQYVPESEKPKGASVESLIELNIQITGNVLASNLDVFKSNAVSVIESINTDLQSDQDFADAEQAVKWCKSTEKALNKAQEDIISQSSDIKLITDTLSELSDQVRSKRLLMEKLVKNQKELRKSELISKAENELRNYISSLNFMKPINFYCDFKKSIFGLKTLSSVQSSISQVLVDAKNSLDKMKSDELKKLEQVNENMTLIKNLSKGYESLFQDAQYLAEQLTLEEVTNTIKDRISNHKKQIQAAVKAEAEAKAAAEAKAKADAEAKAAAEAAKMQVNPLDLTDFSTQLEVQPEIPENLISITQLGEILKLKVNAVLLQNLGIRSSNFMYRESDIPEIAKALIQHLKTYI